MAIYIHLSNLRINFVLSLSLALGTGACRGETRPLVARVWPAMGTMMSAAGWGADSTRVARALAAAHDSVERIDSLVQHHVTVVAIDSVRRDIRRRTGVALPPDTIAPGYALDRAVLALTSDGMLDSALLDVGGQYYWVGPAGRPTHRAVGVADPDNTLRTLAVVDLQEGSIKTASQRNAPKGTARSVTLLAPDGLTASAWAAALLQVGCDRALQLGRDLKVVCADSSGVRWTTGVQLTREP